MRVVALKTLKEFWSIHKEAESSLKDWYNKVLHAEWKNTAEVKNTFGSVDQPCINNTTVSIFNIGGNKYRLVSVIHFNKQVLYIRGILTHSEYDTGEWKKWI